MIEVYWRDVWPGDSQVWRHFIEWWQEENPGMHITTHKEVCPGCRGEGHRDNPAFSNGVDTSDWDEEDFEAYRSGRYDVVCEDCEGKNVITVPDGPPDLMEAWEGYQADARESASIQLQEMRMGA